MDPIPSQSLHSVPHSLPPEISGPSPEEKVYEEAFELAMDVPYIRETLVEVFPKTGKADFKFQNEEEVPGGALNPNFSGGKLALAAPLELSKMQTAFFLARQMGFAVGKEKFLGEHNPPLPGESLETYKKRFLDQLLPKVLTLGYEFEHEFIKSMLRNFGYGPNDFSHEDMDCLSTVYALRFMEYCGMQDYEDEVEQRTGMATVSLDHFQSNCTPHFEAVKKDVAQFAKQMYLKK